eukprot:TRINITY_DN15808_c0_g1::TRINITY_DN15808_c0_g1_i1::g.25553::m.25553 TRINITY_DN15808_c0_g1::TRINITY_DN15808_c0_g1_i1::g.25553  ORF type:complete len:353 (+),score=34.28,sp/Q8RXV3/P2C59_ARATH/45.25/2e-63,PP2C/PF00481.16/2.1e-69,PP2C_2/PF13672.1/2.1e-05,SpoIIE/PF07228.7/0.15 TRINITY_DN15808_c0_g1_i1:181-1239(+)
MERDALLYLTRHVARVANTWVLRFNTSPRSVTYLPPKTVNRKINRYLALAAVPLAAGHTVTCDVPERDSTLKYLKLEQTIRHGSYSIKGRRPTQEDRHFCLQNFTGDHRRGLFGVFDGHAGVRASIFAWEKIPVLLESHPALDTDPGSALTDVVLATDKEFLRLAANFNWDDGTTANIAYIDHEQLFIANVGDSRAVISSAGIAQALSRDHKPEMPEERFRIEQSGGFIRHHGCWRVMGRLAMSRAIGDRSLKNYVIATPEVQTYNLTPKDEFLILACDGLWDVMSNQEAVDFVHRMESNDASSISRALCEYAFERGSADNITVVIVFLNNLTDRTQTSSMGIFSSIAKWFS